MRVWDSTERNHDDDDDDGFVGGDGAADNEDDDDDDDDGHEGDDTGDCEADGKHSYKQLNKTHMHAYIHTRMLRCVVVVVVLKLICLHLVGREGIRLFVFAPAALMDVLVACACKTGNLATVCTRAFKSAASPLLVRIVCMYMHVYTCNATLSRMQFSFKARKKAGTFQPQNLSISAFSLAQLRVSDRSTLSLGEVWQPQIPRTLTPRPRRTASTGPEELLS